MELTAEQYALLEDAHYRTELVRGRLVREPFPVETHGWLAARLTHYLVEHVESHGLGRVLAETGVVTERNPDTVRGPDLAFISRARMAAYPTWDFLHVAPDLCIEVLSRSNRAGELQQKVREYFAAGARLVWLVDPLHQRITVYHTPADIRILLTGEVLDGQDVLPGFRLSLAALFEGVTRPER